jgi:hypothetical protein
MATMPSIGKHISTIAIGLSAWRHVPRCVSLARGGGCFPPRFSRVTMSCPVRTDSRHLPRLSRGPAAARTFEKLDEAHERRQERLLEHGHDAPLRVLRGELAADHVVNERLKARAGRGFQGDGWTARGSAMAHVRPSQRSAGALGGSRLAAPARRPVCPWAPPACRKSFPCHRRS